jgi:hypothetical protein
MESIKTFEFHWFEISAVTFKRIATHKTIIHAESLAEAKIKIDKHSSIIKKIIQK